MQCSPVHVYSEVRPVEFNETVPGIVYRIVVSVTLKGRFLLVPLDGSVAFLSTSCHAPHFEIQLLTLICNPFLNIVAKASTEFSQQPFQTECHLLKYDIIILLLTIA